MKGQGITILDIKESLRAAGLNDLVDRCEQTRKRTEFTRQELEQVRLDLEALGDPALLDDLDIFMAYALGWDSALRNHMRRRSEEDIARKKAIKRPKSDKYIKEVIDFSKGDPVKAMYPE